MKYSWRFNIFLYKIVFFRNFFKVFFDNSEKNISSIEAAQGSRVLKINMWNALRTGGSLIQR